MDRNRCPRSLVAYAAEEVAKAYKFASQDAFSFVRNIDYHPINIEGLSTGFEIVSDRKIKQFDEMEKARFFSTLNRFLINRRHVMKAMLNNLAKMVVNFTSTGEVNEKKLNEIRAQYVASNKAQDELETIGIKLHLENNIEKLLSQIQQERTRAKLMNLFVNQSYLKYGDTVEDEHLDLGHYFPVCTKTEEPLNDICTATSTFAGIVSEDIYVEVGDSTALKKKTLLYNAGGVMDNAEGAIICYKSDKDDMKLDVGFGFRVKAETALDTHDANTERDGLLVHDSRVVESVKGVLTGDKMAIKSEMEEDSKRERSENTPDKNKSNGTLEKSASVRNVAFRKDSLLEFEGEGNDENTNKILDIASDNGWTDDEEDDEDNFVLYGMMNYRAD